MIFDDNLKYACENMSRLLSRNLSIMQCYTKAQYLTAVQGFCGRHREPVERFNQYCVEHEAAAPDAAKATVPRISNSVRRSFRSIVLTAG